MTIGFVCTLLCIYLHTFTKELKFKHKIMNVRLFTVEKRLLFYVMWYFKFLTRMCFVII